MRTAALALAPLMAAAPASSQIQCLLGFLDAYEAPIEGGDAMASRLSRGRAAVRDVLASLAAAHAAHDDAAIDIAEMAAAFAGGLKSTPSCRSPTAPVSNSSTIRRRDTASSTRLPWSA